MGLLELPWEIEPCGEPPRLWRRCSGVRIDLHCHSSFSVERLRFLPGLTFRPLLAPRQVYELAKRRGMDFVTLTDHDTIDGCKALLDECGPLDDFIVGEEVSCAFPEDGTVIHVNVYDIDETQHREIQRLRANLYELVDYLRRIGKLFVLNHMVWTQQHRPLKQWQIEAMLRLFDVFEGLNGTRSYAHNAFAWAATRGRGKILVAGSDSHTHRVGTTYTLTHGHDRPSLLASLAAGRVQIGGAFGTPEKLREDVWLVTQKNLERRLLEASSGWERLVVRGVRGMGRRLYPLVCLGYHRRQNSLIRQCQRELPPPWPACLYPV